MSASTAYTLSLSWDAASDNSGSFGYRVSLSDGREFSLGQRATDLQITSGMVPGRAYGTCVYAVDQAGNRSRSSSCTSVRLPLDGSAPSVPTLSADYVGSDQVVLTWSAASDDGPRVMYEVWMNGAPLSSAGAATSATISDLERDTTYAFAVRALDPYGNQSALSELEVVTTLDETLDDVTAPSAPGSLFVFDGYCGDVLLAWTAAVDDRDPASTLRYEVYVDGQLAQVLVGAREANVLVDGPGLHTFEVVAVDRSGNASASAVSTVDAGFCD